MVKDGKAGKQIKRVRKGKVQDRVEGGEVKG